MIYDIKSNEKASLSRDTIFCDISRGKRVLHVGACDAPETIEKHSKGLLLHAKLNKEAKTLVGIDIDQAAIEEMRNLGFENIINCDLNQIQSINADIDIIILGETIEHVMNLQQLLETIKKSMTESSRLIISTPNAYYYENFRLALKGKERNHPDHKVVFSPATIQALLSSCGLSVNYLRYTFLDREKEPTRQRLAKKIISKVAPALCETIVIECQLQE